MDGDKVSYALGAQAKNGMASVNADGSYSYVPNANYHGSDSFTYSVSDGKGGSNTYTVSLTVNPVNDAPTAANSSQTLNEDKTLSGKLPAATDVDGDKVSYALGAQAKNGKATVNADGSYSYAPNANFHGTDSFTYSVSDGKGGSNTYTVSLTINSVNDAPTAANTENTLNENASATGKLPAATDIDGDKISYALGIQATNGTATVNVDGSYSYTPNAKFYGTDSFTYTVNDGLGGSNTYTVSLTVVPLNKAPVAANSSNTLDEDTSVTGNLPVAVDAEGDKISYALGAQATNGKATVNADGSYSYTPNANFHGADSFTYSVKDDKGNSNSYTVSLSVNSVNDAPIASDSSQNLNGNTAFSGQLPSASDVDGDSVTYAVGAQAANGLVTIKADGSYTYTPNATFHGADSFTYIISDGQGDTNTYSMEMLVNGAPIAANDSQTVNEDSTLLAKLPTASDPENQNITYALETQAANGFVNIESNGNYHYSPNGNFNGSDSFQYSVSDSFGASSTYTVDITIHPINDAPIPGGIVAKTQINNYYEGQLSAWDPEGDPITYKLLFGPDTGTFTLSSTGKYTYYAPANFNGRASFVYEVSDGQDSSSGVAGFDVGFTQTPWDIFSLNNNSLVI